MPDFVGRPEDDEGEDDEDDLELKPTIASLEVGTYCCCCLQLVMLNFNVLADHHWFLFRVVLSNILNLMSKFLLFLLIYLFCPESASFGH